MPTENSVITREHLPGLLLARTIWENGGPSLYFPPALQDATDQARAALPAPASVPDGYMPIPTAEQIADALENVRCFHDMSAELIAPELLANLLAAPTVKAEQVPVAAIRKLLSNWHDLKSGDSENVDAVRNWLDKAPSLPAAGSAEEEVEVVAWRYRHSEQEKWQAGVERKSLWETEPLMTVAQHNRIVAALSAQQSAPERVSVPVERIQIALEAVQNAMEDAYNNAYQNCCGRGNGQCCGEPEPAWSDADRAIMDALAPAQRELSALLASHGRGEA